MITAILTPTSPLRAVFTNGAMPLSRPGAHQATLGKEPARVYFLDLSQVTDEQKKALAKMMAEAGQGTEADGLRHLQSEGELPIRDFHVSSVGLPLKNFM